MIFFVTLIILVVSVFFAIKFKDSLRFECTGMIFTVVSVIAGFGASIMVIVIIANNVGVAGEIQARKQKYDSLVYQAENNLYENDNDLGKKDLANQIQKWNEDLARGKVLQDDFWVGIFYADIYDEFEFIPLTLLKCEPDMIEK